MKTRIITKTLALGILVGLGFTTGCAVRDGRVATAPMHPEGQLLSPTNARPHSQLSYTPVTDPNKLVIWGMRHQGTLRARETYTMSVPTDARPLDTMPTFTEAMPPGTVFEEPAAAAPRGYRVIEHAPHQR